MRWIWILFLALPLSAQRMPVIIDTDFGDSIDDAFALAFALNSPELDIRAVTTVIDDVESKTRLAWKFLGVYNRRDIPLAMGAPEPLSGTVLRSSSKEFEVLTRNDVVPDAAKLRAVDLIIETVLQSRGKTTIVAIGPLTNIALALKTDPRIKNNIERIVIMGGAYFMTDVEYNIRRDRMAAEIVFGSGVPITAVGLDATQDAKLRESDLAKLRVSEDPATTFLMRLVDLAASEVNNPYPTLYDPMAVATLVRPDLVETQEGVVQVPPVGGGRTVFVASPHSSTRVAKKGNTTAFLDVFIERVARGLGR